jgi:hypothetical protein
MKETSCCGTSFAVDCTLSLGSATSRPDIPARLSRAGSPEQGQDLAWPRSSSVRSEQTDPSMRRTCDQEKSEQGISWNGSCGRSDPNGLPEDYPPVRTTQTNQPTITYPFVHPRRLWRCHVLMITLHGTFHGSPWRMVMASDQGLCGGIVMVMMLSACGGFVVAVV